ncbi:MAG TPA: DUF1844 domain-containing protein [Phycisphaerae bacterium]|nr:DUF1844 domain-containing protein [Phycisphaerales bacterium]HNO79183.1 DUF1844 domain-containing protein [Phycisphaerae bacterium]
MTDDKSEPKIIIDSDWKEEAQQEKERLAEMENEAPQGAMPDQVSFIHLINLLAMQAIVGMGGMQDPSTGQPLPADPMMARFHIDLLGLLEEKTKGNLDTDEKSLLSQTLHELRMMFVQITSAPSPQAPPTES